MYVDHFVQLSATEGKLLGSREPFLKRNLPNSQSPILTFPSTDSITAHSGLELKICVNTYKMFFVDNTEDYFYRKRISRSVDESNIEVKKWACKNKKFKKVFCDKWKEGFSSNQITSIMSKYKDFLE